MSVNKAILVGRSGSIETKDGQYGEWIIMSIATNEKWRDKETEEMNEVTDWHRIKVFGPLVEVMSKHCEKGDQIYIEGKMKCEQYEDDEQITRYDNYIKLTNFQFISSPQRDGDG